MAKIEAFFPGTTKQFTITCTINDVAQNITSDTLTARMKQDKGDTDANAVLTSTADVATAGAGGQAIFTFTKDDTKSLTPGEYWLDVEWVTSGGAEYIIYDETIEVKTRTSDVPA